MIAGLGDIVKWASILGLTSSTGPIPPEFIPPGGRYVPTLVLISGLTSASVVLDSASQPLASFVGNSKDAGGEIDCTVRLLITTDGSGGLCSLTISNPIPANFTTTGQAQIVGQPSIVQTLGSVGNTGSGNNNNLTAVTSSNAGVLFTFEAAQINTSYYIDVSWKYEIQS